MLLNMNTLSDTYLKNPWFGQNYWRHHTLVFYCTCSSQRTPGELFPPLAPRLSSLRFNLGVSFPGLDTLSPSALLCHFNLPSSSTNLRGRLEYSSQILQLVRYHIQTYLKIALLTAEVCKFSCGFHPFLWPALTLCIWTSFLACLHLSSPLFPAAINKGKGAHLSFPNGLSVSGMTFPIHRTARGVTPNLKQ